MAEQLPTDVEDRLRRLEDLLEIHQLFIDMRYELITKYTNNKQGI